MMARSLVSVVNARVEYMDWLLGVDVVQTRPPAAALDMRHYHSLLAALPPQAVSVPLVLDALCQQAQPRPPLLSLERDQRDDKEAGSRWR